MRQTLFHLPYLGIPVYGFGLMLFVGFLSATWYSKKKAADEGENPKTIEDIALLILVSGVLGARAFFVIQYNNEFLPSPKLSTIAALIAAMVSIVVLIVGNAFLWRKNKTSAAHVLLPALAAVSIWGCFQQGFLSFISFWMAILIPVTVFGLWVRIVWNAPDKFKNVKVAGVSITSCFILFSSGVSDLFSQAEHSGFAIQRYHCTIDSSRLGMWSGRVFSEWLLLRCCGRRRKFHSLGCRISERKRTLPPAVTVRSDQRECGLESSCSSHPTVQFSKRIIDFRITIRLFSVSKI